MRLSTHLAALLSLLLCFTAAKADTAVTTEATDFSSLSDGYFVVKAKARGITGYLKHVTENANYAPFRIQPNLSAAPTDSAYIWYVTKTTHGIVLFNCGTKQFLPADADRNKNMSTATTVTTAAVLNGAVVENVTTSEWKLSDKAVLLWQENNTPYTDKLFIHANGSSVTDNSTNVPRLSYWDGGSVSSASASTVQFEFYSVTGYTCTELQTAYAVKVTGTTGSQTTTTYKAVATGTDMSAEMPTLSEPEVSYYYTKSADGTASMTTENKTVSKDNCTFEYTVTDYTYTKGDMPFTASTEGNYTWYTIHFRNNEKCNLVKVPSETAIRSNAGLERLNASYDAFNGGLWAFVEDGYGVKLLCKQTGTYVTLANGNNGTAATLSATGTTLIVKTNSSASGTNGGFSLKFPGVDNASLGDHASNTLGIYNTSGSGDRPGSLFTLKEADNIVTTYGCPALTATLTAATPETTGTTLTCGTQTDIDAAKPLATAATTVALLDAAYARAFHTPTPEAAAYYRIANVNCSTKKYAATSDIVTSKTGSLNEAYNADNNTNRTVHREADGTASGASALVPQLWQFEAGTASDGTYKIKSANVECYLCNYTSGNVDLPVSAADAGSYTLKAFADTQFTGHETKTMFQLLCNGKRINALQGEDNNTLADYTENHDNDKGNYWQFEKVTEIPVEINATAGWASVCLPFAVTLPTDETIKAYKGTQAADGKLKLEEITGTVPAKTGFLLAKEGGATATLTIATGDETSLSGNVLCGATAKRTGFAGGANYFLALDSDNKAIFMQSGDSYTQVPCNKAYLPAASIQTTTGGTSTNMLSFELDGGATTGISSAVQSQSDRAEKYYDLSGRRALFPSNGIFVTADGKKVLFK